MYFNYQTDIFFGLTCQLKDSHRKVAVFFCLHGILKNGLIGGI